MDGMLSQEEINALLSGASLDAGADTSDGASAQTDAGDESKVGDILTDIEKDAIGEISNISMGTAATTLNTLVGQPVNITTPRVCYSTWSDMAAEFKARPCVALQLGYKEGLDGENVLILKERDVMVITDLMMGGDGSNTEGELGELQLSAISEAMNQMMGSSSTSLSSMINRKIDILPPVATVVDLNDKFALEQGAAFKMTEFVKVSFKMTIGDLVDSEIMQLYPLDFAKKLYDMFMGNAIEEIATDPDPVQPSQPAQSAPQMSAPDMGSQMPNMGQMPDMSQMPQYGMPYGMPQYGMPYGMPGMGAMPGYPYPPQQQMEQVNVQPAQFQGFSNTVSPVQQKENIDLIMDVPMEVKVELGKTNKSIKDILEFAPGTVIELNKIAGEPVDVLVNGKYVAKGEVVVLEESFAVRITEIIDEKNKQ